MASVRFAPSAVVPKPLPACADASTAAVEPRPGLPGVTVPPSVTPVPREVSVGTHPSWLPEMVDPAAVPLPVKSASWPDTDQPGKVFRVSDTVIAGSAPVAFDPDSVRCTVPGVTVKVKVPDVGTVKVTGRPTALLMMGAHCTGPCWSQAGGIGAVLASVFVPSGAKVGLLQPAMNALVVAGRLAPGIFCSCAKPASTRLIGSAE